MITQKLLDRIDDLGWGCDVSGNGEKDNCYVELSKYSPAGEDFSLRYGLTTIKN